MDTAGGLNVTLPDLAGIGTVVDVEFGNVDVKVARCELAQKVGVAGIVVGVLRLQVRLQADRVERDAGVAQLVDKAQEGGADWQPDLVGTLGVRLVDDELRAPVRGRGAARRRARAT